MTISGKTAGRDHAVLMINAYLDGELDAAAALSVEQQMAADAGLRAEYDRLMALRGAIATHLPREPASESFRNRIAAIATNPAEDAGLPRRRFSAWQMAASVALALLLGSGGTYLGLQHDWQSAEFRAVVAAHQRALLADQPFDIASADTHTVKPWFDENLALSPQVIDLSGAGFTLIGGRIDTVSGQTIPTLVYRRRGHIISVMAFPVAGSRDIGAPAAGDSRDGYAVLTWNGQDFRFMAVSDIRRDELASFVAVWRSNAKDL